ncbi:DUF4381 domain-containing protein [Luteibacter aegosomaticola]|uniref:DUF4381 domain-containing protein n=1 Tax=Luteibacter aegosomaticola TaxID=2911538 RepID=UPI001FF8B6F8|nr:DUF4381 domain-containing protein [Luteibacter aegosomaticola]UPG90798.1 DUF4381 domain-containing protein [Luteibacter aegosomaticola]
MPPQGPELRDIHVPHVSWWPLAPGWWLLAGIIVAALIVLAWRWRRRVHRRRYIDRLLTGLRDARTRHAADGDNAAFAASAHELVRRVARTRDPASVTLSARAWHEALAAMAPARDVTRLAQLDHVMYQPRASLDVDAVANDVDAWVRDVLSHRIVRGKGRQHAAS